MEALGAAYFGIVASVRQSPPRLAEKLGPKGLRAYSLHPGVALGTSLAEKFDDEDMKSVGT